MHEFYVEFFAAASLKIVNIGCGRGQNSPSVKSCE